MCEMHLKIFVSLLALRMF